MTSWTCIGRRRGWESRRGWRFPQRASDRATVQEEKANFVQDQIEYMRGAQVLGKVEEKMQDFRLPDNSVPGKTLNVGQGVDRPS